MKCNPSYKFAIIGKDRISQPSERFNPKLNCLNNKRNLILLTNKKAKVENRNERIALKGIKTGHKLLHCGKY